MSELIEVSGCGNPDRRGDVVFVHGLGGDPTTYWCHAGRYPENFWPRWLGEELPGLGIWSYGYEAAWTGWLGSTMALPQRAPELLEQLDLAGIGTASRPLAFVCHSLGGLVVKYALARAPKAAQESKRRIAVNTRGVCFLATPHQGADIANLIDFLGSFLGFGRITPTVRELVRDSPYLIEMNNDFRREADQSGLAGKVYYETKVTSRPGLPGVLVVSQGSADPGLMHVDAVGVDEDHVSICKPSSRGRTVYRGVRRFLIDTFKIPEEEIKKIDSGESAPLPRPTPPPPGPKKWPSRLVALALLLLLAPVLALGYIAYQRGNNGPPDDPGGKVKPSDPKDIPDHKAPQSDGTPGDNKGGDTVSTEPSPPATPTFGFAKSLGMTMVRIEPDEFDMGSTREQIDKLVTLFPGTSREFFDAEQPQHRVKITRPFYLAAHEVTVGQFRRFVADSGYKTEAEKNGQGSYVWDGTRWKLDPRKNWQDPGFVQKDDHPVVCVSHNDAVAFLVWLNGREAEKTVVYRLPTEAQWEYACRAGTGGLYGGADDPEGLVRIANVADASLKAKFPSFRCIRGDDGFVYTAPVGSFASNAWHLYDMIGNAWEWCDDWYDPKFYQASPSPTEDPHNTAKAPSRVFRGGGWDIIPGRCRPAFRFMSKPEYRDNDLGFRVAAVQD